MRYLYNEMRSMLHNKKICMSFIILLFLNIVCLMAYIDSDRADAAIYKETKNRVINDGINIFDLLMEDYESVEYQIIFSEQQSADTYSEYQKKVIKEAEDGRTVSIFKTEFSTNNINKTQKDYEKLEGMDVRFVGSYGICRTLKYVGGTLMTLIFLIILSLENIIRDKKNGLINLYKTTKNGTGRLVVAKFLASFIFTAVFTACIYISGMAVTGIMYGCVDMSAPVQSLLDYVGFGYRLTILQFLFCDFACKMVFFSTLLALLFFFNMTSGSEVIVFVKSVVFFIVMLLISQLGSRTGNIFLYRFFSGKFADTEYFFGYYNYNVFNNAVNAIWFDVLICLLCIVCLLAVTCYYFNNKEMYYQGNPLNALLLKIRLRRSKGKVKGLWLLEGSKLWLGYKMIYLLLLLVFVQIMTYANKTVHWGVNDYSYKYYVKQIEGDITEEKNAFLIAEDNRYKAIEARMQELDELSFAGKISETEYSNEYDKLSKQLEMSNGFYKCKKYADYVKAKAEEIKNSGDGCKNEFGFVYDRGYNLIIGRASYNSELLNAIMLCIVCFFVTSFLFFEDYKYKINELIATTANSGRLERVKALKAFLILAFTYLLIYVPELIWVVKEVGLSGLGYNIQSIYDMRNVNIDVSILQYMIIINIIRFFSMLVLMLIMVCIGKKVKNSFVVLICAFFVIILPLVMAYFGISGFDNYFIIKLLSGRPYA